MTICMELRRFGDDDMETIEFPNGMVVDIDYTIGETEEYGFGWGGRVSGKYRRIRLYDKDDNLISEVIGLNPLYLPPLHDDSSAHEDSN